MVWLTRSWEKHPALLNRLSVVGLVLLCGVAFFWNLGSIGLIDETEPLFAEAARQMTVTGDWITPYFNGETRFDKPPLIYWLMAIAYQVLGVNEWSVRLPSALAATALTVMGFYVLRRYGFPSPQLAQTAPDDLTTAKGDRQRWLAAWIGSSLIALNFHTLVWARTGVSDMLLSGCMGTAMLAFFCGYAESDRPRIRQGWYLAFYGLLALAVLAKGPVGVVLPGLTIGLFLLYTGTLWAVLREMRLLWGSIIFLAIAVPWYVLVIQRNGQSYIESFFDYHNVERFTQVVNGHSAPWYFYFLVVLGGFFPWSVYLPVAMARLRLGQRSQWLQQPRSAHLGLFALMWFVAIFGFFTIAVTKLPSYVLPLMPAAAILIGLLWSDYLTRPQPPRPWAIALNLSHGFCLLLCLGIAILILNSPALMSNDPSMPTLPEVMRQSGLLPAGALIWGGVAIATLGLMIRRRGAWVWFAQFIGFVLFFGIVVMPVGFIVDELRQAPLRELAAVVVEEQRPNEPIAMIGFEKPSLVFYTRQPVLYWNNPKAVIRLLHRLERQADAPDSILLLGYPDKLDRSDLPLSLGEELGTIKAFQLFRIPLPLPPGLKVPT